jgi:hypothetical protein
MDGRRLGGQARRNGGTGSIANAIEQQRHVTLTGPLPPDRDRLINRQLAP